MDRTEIITLIKEEYTQDDIGKFVNSETSREVYATVRSISRAEWFDAGRNGMKPEVQFRILEYEYDDEPIIEYAGKRYSVYRTYKADNEFIELYCELKGGI